MIYRVFKIEYIHHHYFVRGVKNTPRLFLFYTNKTRLFRDNFNTQNVFG